MMGCRNRAVTGSTERLEARGAINTAIRSRTYTNTVGELGWAEAKEAMKTYPQIAMCGKRKKCK